jgi:hypothetical protein
MNSIESVNNKFNVKVNLITSAAKKIDEVVSDTLPAAGDSPYLRGRLENISTGWATQAISRVHANYNLAVVDTLCLYYRGKNVTDDYYKNLHSGGFFSAAGTICSKLLATLANTRAVLELLEISDDRLKIAEIELARASDLQVAPGGDSEDTKKCPCGAKLYLSAELGEGHCKACGEVSKLVGEIFKQESGDKSKNSGYDTSRHCKNWLNQILCRNPKEIPPAVVESIRAVMIRDKIIPRTLNCEKMRRILRDPAVKQTSYNNSTTYLIKIFGGPTPPEITFEEERENSVRFNKLMKLYTAVAGASGNRPYYPYFIYKNFELMFEGNREKLRVLDFIHLQSNDTVIKNDLIYKKMCEQADPADGFKYIPTVMRY